MSNVISPAFDFDSFRLLLVELDKRNNLPDCYG